VKPTREWTSAEGIRCFEWPNGNISILDEDLAKWLLTIDPAACDDAAIRQALSRFQREVVVMQPDAQYRRAVALMTEIGSPLPKEFQTLKPR